MDELRSEKIPYWFWLLLLLIVLPMFLVPKYVSDIEASEYEIKKFFIWLYVPYVVIGALLTALCYRYGRRVMAWILYVLMVLTHVAMYYLVY
ncbi:MAG: hypothetical protein ACI30M_07830 [Muribaculaceae bacterium]